ncbi:hypothetical protein Vadar_018641 [Vaccinium darrowii]|uniref:Uncharacterized protein n=1 Tax=Vaccinium darrowii TaxID=229202 RepID=A0ACB7XST4_9ERIC|nr:hypothetical protein Vadar_018641 [Vaccinium darrowii]
MLAIAIQPLSTHPQIYLQILHKPSTASQFFVTREVSLRLHTQALMLAALAGAAVVKCFDHMTGAKEERDAKFLDLDGKLHKD